MSRRRNDQCDTALEVTVVEDAVVLTGPRGVALALTIAAAERSIDVLREAIERARLF
jgi:hypothetical protein